eukprot:CAMPEP_0119554240 /NCGR_PEP_ID=MMETSP1352-20130426/6792_1 /TAXON_ID=265584 /ORGANISM="Stauroneis constricta, Strain CCMP1120" /LENGTH=263 /DNA_ID=CAMNT_0007600803 /DNA_START=29 /DNA_END=820 /DNA_ORIENTATION=+
MARSNYRAKYEQKQQRKQKQPNRPQQQRSQPQHQLQKVSATLGMGMPATHNMNASSSASLLPTASLATAAEAKRLPQLVSLEHGHNTQTAKTMASAPKNVTVSAMQHQYQQHYQQQQQQYYEEQPLLPRIQAQNAQSVGGAIADSSLGVKNFAAFDLSPSCQEHGRADLPQPMIAIANLCVDHGMPSSQEGSTQLHHLMDRQWDGMLDAMDQACNLVADDHTNMCTIDRNNDNINHHDNSSSSNNNSSKNADDLPDDISGIFD